MSTEMFMCTTCESRPSCDGKPGLCDKCYYMSWDNNDNWFNGDSEDSEEACE